MGKLLQSRDRAKRTVRISGPARYRETPKGPIAISRQRSVAQAVRTPDYKGPVEKKGLNVGYESRDGQVQVEVAQGSARKKMKRTEEVSDARNDEESNFDFSST